jgi:predicted nucleotidyltransferase
MNPYLDLDRGSVERFCHRHSIRRLSLFGSALREGFRPESDIDLLVEFEEGARVGLFQMVAMEDELSSLLGRRVDLRTSAELSRYFREDVVAGAETLYAA